MNPPVRGAAPLQPDQQLEQAMGHLLRFGVLLAAALVLAGGLLLLRHPSTPAPDLTYFHPPGSASPATLLEPLHSIAAVVRGLASPGGLTIIAAGLLVLIATPVARVVFAVVGFARERDRLYLWVSLAVLAILLCSLLRGA